MLKIKIRQRLKNMNYLDTIFWVNLHKLIFLKLVVPFYSEYHQCRGVGQYLETSLFIFMCCLLTLLNI